MVRQLNYLELDWRTVTAHPIKISKTFETRPEAKRCIRKLAIDHYQGKWYNKKKGKNGKSVLVEEPID